MDIDTDINRLKECIKNNNNYINLSGSVLPENLEEFENLLSKITNKNTEIYVHGFLPKEQEDIYLISLAKGISGNKNIVDLCYARMHMHGRALPYYTELLATNPNLKIDFVQENIEIDLFKYKRDH